MEDSLGDYLASLKRVNALPVKECIDDVYAQESVSDILSIRTYYESQWLERGLTIKYISFGLAGKTSFVEPDVEIELDEYRSYNRSKRSSLQTSK